MELFIELYRFVFYSTEMRGDLHACDSGLYSFGSYLSLGLANIFHSTAKEVMLGVTESFHE